MMTVLGIRKGALAAPMALSLAIGIGCWGVQAQEGDPPHVDQSPAQEQTGGRQRADQQQSPSLPPMTEREMQRTERDRDLTDPLETDPLLGLEIETLRAIMRQMEENIEVLSNHVEALEGRIAVLERRSGRE